MDEIEQFYSLEVGGEVGRGYDFTKTVYGERDSRASRRRRRRVLRILIGREKRHGEYVCRTCRSRAVGASGRVGDIRQERYRESGAVMV